jgi:hypothetical protein
VKERSRLVRVIVWSLTGAIEVSSAILLLLPSRAVFGSILLACTLVGTILTHLVNSSQQPCGPSCSSDRRGHHYVAALEPGALRGRPENRVSPL